MQNDEILEIDVPLSKEGIHLLAKKQAGGKRGTEKSSRLNILEKQPFPAQQLEPGIQTINLEHRSRTWRK